MIVLKKENGGLRIQAEGGCFCNVNTVIALSGDIVKCDDLGKTVFDARSIANHCKNYYVNNSGGFLANALADMTASVFDKYKDRKWDVTYVIFEMKDGTPWFTKIHVYNEWGMTCRVKESRDCDDLMVFDGKFEDRDALQEGFSDCYLDSHGGVLSDCSYTQ